MFVLFASLLPSGRSLTTLLFQSMKLNVSDPLLGKGFGDDNPISDYKLGVLGDPPNRFLSDDFGVEEVKPTWLFC